MWCNKLKIACNIVHKNLDKIGHFKGILVRFRLNSSDLGVNRGIF